MLEKSIAELKKRRRSVKPAAMHALLTEAGFERRYGPYPLLPVYVSKAIRAIEEVLADEER